MRSLPMPKTGQVPKQRRSVGESCYEDRLLHDSVLEKDHLPIKSNTYESLNKNPLEDKLLQEPDEDALLFEAAEAEDAGRGLIGGSASEATRMTAFRQ